MNKKLLTCLFAIAIMLVNVSCSDDDEDEPKTYYYEPVAFIINVTDSIGNNLLDPNNPDNLIDKGLTISYDDSIYTIYGVEYYLKKEAKTAQTRALPMGFAGAILYNFDEKPVCLMIGFEYEEANNPWSESFTLNWPDGTKTELSFYVNETGRDKAHYYIDGKAHASDIFDFVK